MSEAPFKPHDYDEDGICTRCGFDGAEWWHWKHNTYEGRASDLKTPPCEETRTA